MSGESENSDEMQLWNERLIWSSPLSSPLEEQTKLPIAQLKCDCILRDIFLADLKRAEISYQVVFSSPVVDKLASAVEENLAITLLPESVLHANRTSKVPSNLIKSNRTLSINMIYRPEIDDTTLEAVSNCMRQASNNQRHTADMT
ncbi:LysR family transcriptional regulator substrate-binding protein [Pontibacterium granulatum]|uniref:LysR family transcriptional regulator substrate-binding protein n=1 Tax=Pontibacterium granulatum TaxID=2036029 RepID=UPI00249C1D8E|nr:LysR family transcriptional regulator substrate-binding protein [Pontibacterium granulatum]MDI3326274.1 LysR family transcriptional regulator substrate-binding protein [Pontibacterium granulatum]